MKINRIQLAYIFSPILPSVVFTVVFHLSEPKLIIFMLVFAIPFSYLPCLIFGMPYISFLKKRKQLTLVNLLLGGIILGGIFFYIFGITFSIILDSPRSLEPTLRELLSGASLGFLVALLFGLIAGLPFYRTYDCMLDNDRNP